MADTSISNLTLTTPATAAHRIPIAITPFGSGNNGYITPALILSYGTSPITGTTVTGTTITATTKFVSAIYSADAGGYAELQGTSGAAMMSINATRYVAAYASKVYIASAYPIGWTSSGDAVSTTADVNISRYAAKQLMISGDGTGTASSNVGWIMGAISGGTYGAIWPSNAAATSSAQTSVLNSNGTTTSLNAPNSGSGLFFTIHDVTKGRFPITDGAGLAITAGTAATDVSAVTVTQTWNEGSTAFTGLKHTFTSTASAAATKMFDYIVGTTSYWAMNKSGIGTMAAYGAGSATFSAAGVISSVSDESVKTDIRPFERGLDAILALSQNHAVITYKYNAAGASDYGLDTVHDYTGFSANIVEEIIPEAVGRNADGRRSFSDRPVTAALVNAVAALESRIALLETKH